MKVLKEMKVKNSLILMANIIFIPKGLLNKILSMIKIIKT